MAPPELGEIRRRIKGVLPRPYTAATLLTVVRSFDLKAPHHDGQAPMNIVIKKT